MIEAVVGVALRAVVASVLLGGLLAGLVLVATRTLSLTAATRHALWSTALLATAIMPLAGIGVSVWRAAAPAAVASPGGLHTATASRGPVRPLPVSLARDPRPVPASASRVTMAEATQPSLLDRLAVARWTPRTSHALAVGLVAVWAAGALAGIAGLLAGIARVRGLKRRSSPIGGELADELPWLTEAGPGREIYLRLSYETETPVAIGFRRPVILIPTELATADGLTAIEPLILHEHAHLRRYDDWTNLAQRAIERVFWFNPIVWLVGRRIALEREIASDDAVVAKTGAAHAYATSLWQLAREMRMPEHTAVAPGALLTRKQIVVRIEQLLDARRGSLHRSPAAAAATALAGVLAVAFVASSAPAVELPAVPASAAKAPPAIAARRSRTKPVVAAHAASTPAVGPRASSPRQITRYVFVEVPRPADRAATARAASSARAAAQAAAAAALAVPRDGEPDAVPSPAPVALPPVPALPLPAEGTRKLVVVVPSLPPATLAKIRGASGGRDELAAIGPNVGRIVRDVLAFVPADLARQGASSLTRVHDGARATRAMVAACLGCSFRDADLHELDLHGLYLTAADLSGADLHGANLAGTTLSGVHLREADLAGADLRNARFIGVELRDANLDGARLEGARMMGVSFAHVNVHGTTLRSVLTSCVGCDFTAIDLRGQDLRGVVLTGVNLRHADLRDASLRDAHLTGVDLSYANLAGTDLTNARVDDCELQRADLRGARTTGMLLDGSSRDG